MHHVIYVWHVVYALVVAALYHHCAKQASCAGDAMILSQTCLAISYIVHPGVAAFVIGVRAQGALLCTGDQSEFLLFAVTCVTCIDMSDVYISGGIQR